MRFLLTLMICAIVNCGWAQDKTISRKETPSRESRASHKVMIIPFEPKLYLSEVDHHITNETQLSPRQIRNRFRDGLNEQLYRAFRNNNFNVVDLMDDTVKYKKDIEGIYQYVAYDYLKVPDQNNYRTPTREKQKSKNLDKGQLIVETNSEARFMHARVTDARVVPLLYGKYRTDLYVFISQLDIRAGGESAAGMSPNRRIVVHYTVYTYDAKEINSGTIEQEFDPTINNPKKIIEKYFSSIASTLVQRVNKGLNPAK